MKRFLTILLCLALAASVFTGCKQSGGSTTAGGTSRVGAKGSLPLATSKPILSMFIAGGYADNLTSFDYSDNTFTKKVVDETGVQLQVTSTSSADANERLSLMLNTGDYPDIIFTAYSNIDFDYYAQQGILIPLDNLEPLSFPYIKRAFDLYPEAMRKMAGADDKIYSLPYIDVCLHCDYSFGRWWYNMPWIRDNNRRVPETVDELTDFLRWAKSSDPNGNGRNDELGIVMTKDDLYNLIAYIARAYMPFVFTGDYFGLAMDSSRQVVEQYRDDNFRAALAYLADLYREGLIVPDGFSMTYEQTQVIARSPDTIAPILANSWVQNLVPMGGDRFMDYFVMPPLRTSSGQRYAPNGDPWSSIGARYFITNKCRDPELAVALYDYFQRDDVLKNAYGPKGVFWVDPDPGAVGTDGKPAYWKWIGTFGVEPLNSHWGNFSPHVWIPEMRAGIQMDDVETMARYMATGDRTLKDRVQANISYTEYMFFNSSMELAKNAIPGSNFIPPLLMNTADKSRYGDINAVLDPFKQQVFVEFITGTRDINNNAQWNAYLSELDRLSSREVVQLLQKYIR